jgi:hypothetical protein
LNNYFVCYRRPPPIVFDDATGLNVYANPSGPFGDDKTPDTLGLDLETACGSFQGTTTMIANSISKTYNNADYVSSAMSSIGGAYTTITNLRNGVCQRGNLTPEQTIDCTAISNFGLIGADANYSTLLGNYTTLSTTISNMKGLYVNDVVPKFSGLNCKISSITFPPGV